MPEHTHEWTAMVGDGIFGQCSDKDCHKVLDWDEVDRRLNATEKLSAQDAQFLGGFAGWFSTEHLDGFGMWTAEEIFELGVKGSAYAMALEGEDVSR